MRIIHRLTEISDRFDALFCDVWGCIHNGVSPFGDAVEALTHYRAGGGKVLLLTNAPRPWRDVERHLSILGVTPDCWDAIVTSGDAAKAALFDHRVGVRVFHIGPERDKGFFAVNPEEGFPDAGIHLVEFEQADGIVCTGLFDDDVETPQDYRQLLTRAAASGLPFLCANPDIVVDRGDLRVYCAGALARLYWELGGRVLQFGKPRGDIYALARKLLTGLNSEPVPDHRLLCIGDGPVTDVEGAVRQRLSCLFVSGGLAAAETGTGLHPDPERLAEFCRAEGINPEFVIGTLR